MALGKKIAKAIRAKRAAGGSSKGMGGALRRVATKIAKKRGGGGDGGGGPMTRIRKAGSQKRAKGAVGAAIGAFKKKEGGPKKPPRTGGIKPAPMPNRQAPIRRRRPEADGGRVRKRMGGMGVVRRAQEAVMPGVRKGRFMGRYQQGSDK